MFRYIYHYNQLYHRHTISMSVDVDGDMSLNQWNVAYIWVINFEHYVNGAKKF